ncbi:hypothetical protein ZHAS_00012277 [Anopheles sinensis]|uniref:Uncharacterized protein n=1 Tax=Anopheles sinensis TaxID=74873 RepID=A0A084W295_ANOSI|nr:hypothetical protein ZHAS_00012277 [Anopheles sinensis]
MRAAYSNPIPPARKVFSCANDNVNVSHEMVRHHTSGGKTRKSKTPPSCLNVAFCSVICDSHKGPPNAGTPASYRLPASIGVLHPVDAKTQLPNHGTG